MPSTTAQRTISAPASMKVPPKRKGNDPLKAVVPLRMYSLNESPSEKEGKSGN